MDNKNDKIFSSIYPRPQADHQGGQIARDHLMSNLRDHYLVWDAMIFGWQSGFQLWAETAKDDENWSITISVFVCFMSVICLSHENLRTETAQDAEASPQQHHWCQTQGTCVPAQCVPVQCVPAQCVPVQCAPAQCTVCSCKVCTCTVCTCKVCTARN